MAPAGTKSASKGDKIVSKKSLFDDDSSSSSSSDDDQEDGGATLDRSSGGQAQLKINEEFARRFEHNKKREELHRLEEKFKSKKDGGQGLDESDSSEDETEDDEGFLVTEDLDAQISATLQAIKNKDPIIYNKEAVFYDPIDPDAPVEKEKKEKPVFLRDYHRERYLKGDIGAEEEEPEVPKRSYAQEQADLKNAIVSEINAAAADDEEWSDDDAFIKPVKKAEPEQPAGNGMHPSRAAALEGSKKKHVEIKPEDVANADKNPEEFLSKFMASKAWAPPEGSRWAAFESDDEEEDDDIAEQVEHAYNMRFEDPTKANEVLKTYSRTMTSARSVRKEELTGRKKQRQLEKERKEAEKKEREEERARLRRLKIDEAAEKLAKIKKAAGIHGKSLTDEEWVQFLEDAWDDDKWEEEMRKRFGDDYYAEADDLSMDDAEDSEEEDGDSKKKKNKKPKKPKWDDDIDIKDLVPDFEDEALPKVTLSDLEKEEEAAAAAEEQDSSDSDDERPTKKRKTTAKDLKKEKIAAKRAAKAELAKLEAIVDHKMEIDNPRALSGKKDGMPAFRYRETSPQSFGMTARDILLAPSDAALNEFAGLKKLATFRDAEKKRKDKKHLGKKARLRQWRREVFGKEYERTGPTFGFGGKDDKLDGEASGANAIAVSAAQQQQLEEMNSSSSKTEKKEKKKDKKEGNDEAAASEKIKDGKSGIVEGERKKKRKRSKNKGKKSEEAEE